MNALQTEAGPDGVQDALNEKGREAFRDAMEQLGVQVEGSLEQAIKEQSIRDRWGEAISIMEQNATDDIELQEQIKPLRDLLTEATRMHQAVPEIRNEITPKEESAIRRVAGRHWPSVIPLVVAGVVGAGIGTVALLGSFTVAGLLRDPDVQRCMSGASTRVSNWWKGVQDWWKGEESEAAGNESSTETQSAAGDDGSAQRQYDEDPESVSSPSDKRFDSDGNELDVHGNVIEKPRLYEEPPEESGTPEPEVVPPSESDGSIEQQNMPEPDIYGEAA